MKNKAAYRFQSLPCPWPSRLRGGRWHRIAGWIMVGLLPLFALHASASPQTRVRIAAIFSRTGIAAAHNAPLIQMTQLAVNELNRNGGLLGNPVDLIVIDNRSTAIGSAVAAREAVKRKVTAVIGAHWSSHSLAMAPILQAAGIPMISPGSTNPAVTRVGDYIFRVCFLDSFQGQAMARFARENLHADTAAVIFNLDETYSVTLADFFKKAFSVDGGRIVLDEGYRGKAVDFSDIIARAKARKPAVTYVPGYTRDSGLLIKQAALLGFKTTFLGGDAWDEIANYAGDALNGAYQSAPWDPHVPFARSRHLKALYQRAYGHPIKDLSAPLAYDAVMVLADAIRRAGVSNHRKIRDALAATQGFKGATGVITFDPNGDPQGKDVIILKYDGSRPRFFKNVRP